MLAGSRVVWKDNATLRDVSRELSDLLADPLAFAFNAAQDHLFIGSDFPFNHRFFKPRVGNTAVSAPSIALWDGSDFQAVAEVIDWTKNAAGASLAQPGNILWVPDETKGWSREASTANIPALSTLKIYNKYWARIAWDVNLDSTTELAYLGHRFSNDADFKVFYPDLLRAKHWDAFEQGKTNWDDQHIAASEQVVDQLIARNAVYSADQFLDPSQLRDAAVHRTAQIIMNAFGDDWETERQNAEDSFEEALEKKVYAIDRDGDARLSPRETVRSARLIRR